MIVPGSANPLLLAQSADPLDEFGVVARSIRCRSAASALISRTPGVAGNRQTWAARFYVKRGTLGVFQALMDATPATPATENTWLAFTATDQLQFCQQTANVHVGEKVTNRVFRDTAAHIEIEIVFDSTNAVAADRMRIYINGVRETSFATSVDIAQNALSYVNAANVHYIGGAPGTGIGYFDGLISSVVITDGTMPDPSVFGQVHARTGQRRPKSKAAIKAIADAGGTNSVFLTFDDPTNTTTLCADASSKGNNWTSTNISLTAGITYDSLIDTPTNNFPVLNATYAAYGTAAGNITEGGLKFASSSTYHFTPCTIPLPAKGQWVAEFVPQDTVSIIGLADLDNGSGSSQNIGSGLGWYGSILYTGNASAVQSGLATQAANDIITVAVDMDALSAKWYQNGVLRITQALTAGKRYAFACGDYYAPGATSCFANFGQRAFSYAPNGYKALSTKNLPVNPGGPMKSTNAFVAVADTGVNILSTLAAARSGWSSYIDIIKRRDTAEGWRLIFSDDPTYYLDWSGVAAKAAIPAFGGTSYGGLSLKVGAANGVATGRLAHVNGVADVVNDGLANSRKAIILVNEAGSTWYVYHPELTAGKLLYFTTSAETTDATISSVTSSGFTVAASLPTGTYRWISMAESEGFLKLTKTVGNGAADGFSDYAALQPAALFQKPINGVGNWSLFDNARDKQNIASGWLIPNTTSGESTLAAFDLNSNGVKCRYAGGSDINTAATIYAQILIAAFPFRYANAR